MLTGMVCSSEYEEEEGNEEGEDQMMILDENICSHHERGYQSAPPPLEVEGAAR